MEIFRYGRDEIEYLKQQDRRLAAAIDQIGVIERPVIPDLFTALVSSIVHQQISNKAAATVWGRVLNHFGKLTPAAVAATPVETVQQLGLSMRKAGYIHAVAASVAAGELDLERLTTLPDAEVIEVLSAQPGIGVWTAEMLMIFSMQRPDVISWHDLAIRRGMLRLYGLDELTRAEFDNRRRIFSPYGSVASLYFWQISKENNYPPSETG
jgi:DNA-3-methyladenine glycosylase II